MKRHGTSRDESGADSDEQGGGPSIPSRMAAGGGDPGGVLGPGPGRPGRRFGLALARPRGGLAEGPGGVRGPAIRRAEAELARLGRLREPDSARLAAPGPARDGPAAGSTRPSDDLAHVPDDHPMAAQARLQAGPAGTPPRPATSRPRRLSCKALELDPKLVQARRELVYIYGMQLRRPELNATFQALSEVSPLTYPEVFLWCLTRG